MYKGVLEWDLKLDLQRLLKSAFLESLHNEAYTNMQMNKIKHFYFGYKNNVLVCKIYT